jgi:hypothetical protein
MARLRNFKSQRNENSWSWYIQPHYSKNMKGLVSVFLFGTYYHVTNLNRAGVLDLDQQISD